jgi:hypothetical protein
MVFFNNEGFVYKKSNNSFNKTVDGSEFEISLDFDGRGGLTHVDAINYTVTVLEFRKIIRSIFKNRSTWTGLRGKISHMEGYKIPIMYGTKAHEHFCNVDLKSLSKMVFEEKYPESKISDCADYIITIYNTKIKPFFKKADTLENIYKIYMNANPIYEDENPLGIGWQSIRLDHILFINLLCSKLNLPKPPRVADYTHHKVGLNQEMVENINKVENYVF